MVQPVDSLQNLIEILDRLSGAHICIHDVSGILKHGALTLAYPYQFHSSAYCTAAKSTPKGYRLCTRCKMHANEKAITGKDWFEGSCPFGLHELAYPVLEKERPLCIIYIGHVVLDPRETRRRIRHACRLTGVPPESLLSLLPQAQTDSSMEPYLRWARLIESYIRLLYRQARPVRNADADDLHWAVLTLQDYIHMNYARNISLREAARLYFISDKYIGRLFKEQLGCTFREYLNEVRLENAAAQLRSGRDSVLSIAMDCGFQNVTYFNRVFRKKFQMSPTAYRLTKP